MKKPDKGLFGTVAALYTVDASHPEKNAERFIVCLDGKGLRRFLLFNK